MERLCVTIGIVKGDLCGFIASAIYPYSDALSGHRFSVVAEDGKIAVSQGA
ncbi:MAG: hypothetical protein ACE5GK_10570 [Nitrospiria bacterium]